MPALTPRSAVAISFAILMATSVSGQSLKTFAALVEEADDQQSQPAQTTDGSTPKTTSAPTGAPSPEVSPVSPVLHVNTGAFNPTATAMLIVDNMGNIESNLTNALVEMLQATTGFFTLEFVRSQRFARAHGGDVDALKQSGVLDTSAARIILGVSSVDVTRTDLVPTVKSFTATGHALLRVYYPQENFRSSTFSTDVRRGAFSEEDARRDANVELAKAIFEQLTGSFAQATAVSQASVPPTMRLTSLEALAKDIGALASGQTIVVMPCREFKEDTEAITARGRRLADTLRNLLTSQSGLRVIIRHVSGLTDILEMAQVDQNAFVDPATVKKLELSGNDILVSCAIYEQNGVLILNSLLLRLSKGEAFGGRVVELRERPRRAFNMTGSASWAPGARLNPKLPRNLTAHDNNHIGDPFLTGFAGITPLDRITSPIIELEAGGQWRPPGGPVGMKAEYVVKLPRSSDDRFQIKQVNDTREASLGSFIYSRLVDMNAGQAFRFGFLLRPRMLQARHLEAEFLFDYGRWDMTFEKGWQRFGIDQPELTARATGRETSPRVRLSFGEGLVGGHVTGSWTIIQFSYDSTFGLPSHYATGWSIGGGITLRSRFYASAE